MSKLRTNLQTLPGKLVMSFQWDIRVGSKREYYFIALPGWLHQFVPEEFRRVDLDDNLSFKIGPGAVAQILVGRAAKAIGATVDATTIAVDRVIEADVRAIVMRDY